MDAFDTHAGREPATSRSRRTLRRARWRPTAGTALLAVVALAAGALTACDGGAASDDGAASVDESAAGSVSVAVSAPAELGEVTATTDDTLEASAPDATTIADPVHVTVDGRESLRTDGPITLTFDLGTVPDDPDLIQIAYWDGSQWWMLRPDEIVDSTATLTTFHLSWLWPTKLTPEQREQQMLGRAVNSELARSQTASKVDEVSEQYIGAMLQQLDIRDGAVRAQLVEAMRQAPGYRDLQKQFAKGKLAAFVPVLQKVAGEAFGSYLEGKTGFLVHPEGFGNKPGGLATKLGTAYGSFEAGDYDAAGRALSGALMDVLPKPVLVGIWEAGSIATRVTINVWKSDEIDAAYEAWRHGADGVFFGYNVEPDHFDGLWTQMRGIATRLQSEAVTRFEKAAAESGIEVTDAQRDAVRDQVRAGLLEEFQRRRDNEDRKAELQKELKELLDRYEDANLLNTSRYGYDSSVSREERFQQLLDIKARIIADLERDDMSMGSFTTDETVSVFDVVRLTQTLLSSGGEKAYADQLAEEFGIGGNVDLSGRWSGHLTITSVDAPEDSCLAGMEVPTDPAPLTLDITANPGGRGVVTVTADDETFQSPLSWSGNTLKFTISTEGVSIAMSGTATIGPDGSGSISGSLSGTAMEGHVGGTWSAARGG